MINLNIKKNYVVLILFVFIFCIAFLSTINLADAKLSDWKTKLDIGAEKTELYTVEEASGNSVAIAKYVGKIIWILPILGFVFMIQLVIASYQWMTAAGNAEKVQAAQKRIIHATIAIVIFAAIYLIAYFFINALSGATKYQIAPTP
ncbi:hypothetical protein KKC83_02405 [Patescibacteria group bacterium]|nr:hypothetical protein [Candidatus Falkowbacteria bacterium]MBU3905992.1 hypothetical protein [Patescibacteria group bacterium]MCG2697555.1 hypothetical protein [Candidatus Parcubacteria bacterium]MBU4014779.1 hypothetical protein [Patescibacteria group bacterium]MBU4026368.1 hypothetical protein [Patescibacteria group bacterium]